LVVKRLIVIFAITAALWAFAITLVWAQDSTDAHGNIVVTTGSLYMLAGMCVLVVPLTAWVTKLAGQVAEHDRRLEKIEGHSEDLIREGIEVGRRIATSVESLAAIPGAGRTSDPERGRRY